jgi:histidinol-phosphate phosphatase family protein
MERPATVLLDRDGVINRMRPDYVKRWEEMELLPGAVEALARLSRAGCRLVVLTNQSAIGRGILTHEGVDEIHQRLDAVVKEAGGRIDAYLVCPHAPADACACRKPAPGLLLRARDELGVDLGRAVLIGDQPSDLEAAEAARCDAILVDPEGRLEAGSRLSGELVVRSLAEATDLILGEPSDLIREEA